GLGESGRVERLDVSEAGVDSVPLVEVVPAEETESCAHKWVVHLRVELVAGQPAMGVAPQLANDVGFWIDLLAAAAKLPPEAIVVDFGRDVEAPAVNALFQPIRSHVPQKLADHRVLDVELR